MPPEVPPSTYVGWCSWGPAIPSVDDVAGGFHRTPQPSPSDANRHPRRQGRVARASSLLHICSHVAVIRTLPFPTKIAHSNDSRPKRHKTAHDRSHERQFVKPSNDDSCVRTDLGPRILLTKTRNSEALLRIAATFLVFSRFWILLQ